MYILLIKTSDDENAEKKSNNDRGPKNSQRI